MACYIVSMSRSTDIRDKPKALVLSGQEDVAPYLKSIVPPVLVCFVDQDARVRYYACESMYNIAKVAKGEILLFFNDMFDALCKLAADSELSVKNGAELLDRLLKDIVAESASTYVSILHGPSKEDDEPDHPTAFSLAAFIPLLQERIIVINPFTRTFLVSWVTLLDTIPDLELVHHLPAFLEGLFNFLNDPNRDVYVATNGTLERFLSEIRRIAHVQKGVEIRDGESVRTSLADQAIDDAAGVDDYIPGQDVEVDHAQIIQILVGFLDNDADGEVQITSLRWIDQFFAISPGEILPFVPPLLTHVLPAMSSGTEAVRLAADRVNDSLMEYIASLPTDESAARRIQTEEEETPTNSPLPKDLDYMAAVNALTLHFLNEQEATRVAALAWLILLHKRAPKKVLATNEGTFPALLKTLSDSAEAVVTKDLQLLSQISKNSDDSYFSSFMVNLLQLFATDRKLLEARGNLIIRQLCVSLSSERIYRSLADCLEKDEDVEFASIMVQNLNNNLITAPELAELRKRLRNLETKDGQTFFVALFRSWCYNAVATFSLCLLAQAYEQAYHLLLIFADLEMTVNMLIQIDKLVQLLESPVFTYLRLQLLEPERYPFLYRCLYGVLMLLPQSSAFAALKNRLNSVSGIGFLQMPRANNQTSSSTSFDRPNRLKAREDNQIPWTELLDKFKIVQDRARRASRPPTATEADQPLALMGNRGGVDSAQLNSLLSSRPDIRPPTGQAEAHRMSAEFAPPTPIHKNKSGLSHLGRFAGGVSGRSKNKK